MRTRSHVGNATDPCAGQGQNKAVRCTTKHHQFLADVHPRVVELPALSDIFDPSATHRPHLHRPRAGKSIAYHAGTLLFHELLLIILKIHLSSSSINIFSGIHSPATPASANYRQTTKPRCISMPRQVLVPTTVHLFVGDEATDNLLEKQWEKNGPGRCHPGRIWPPSTQLQRSRCLMASRH